MSFVLSITYRDIAVRTAASGGIHAIVLLQSSRVLRLYRAHDSVQYTRQHCVSLSLLTASWWELTKQSHL